VTDSATVSETREVRDFDQVRLEDYGELVITQGDEEALTIEASADMMSRIVSEVRDGRLTLRIGRDWLERILSPFIKLSIQPIRFRLTVRRLVDLGVFGAASVDLPSLQTESLALTMSGAGEIKLPLLTAESLAVNLPGAGRISVAGQVGKQSLKLSGAGSYQAGDLHSASADVRITGAGTATVWVDNDLDVNLSGLGKVQYYGAPNVKQFVTGLGRVVGLGEHQM
jgi:hypothetical protein